MNVYIKYQKDSPNFRIFLICENSFVIYYYLFIIFITLFIFNIVIKKVIAKINFLDSHEISLSCFEHIIFVLMKKH